MIPHVRNSDGGGHGPHQTVPDDFDLEDCEKAGTGNINVSERVISDTDSGKELYICNICGKRSKGYRGFAIHLSKTEDDDEHPVDVDHLDPSDYTIVSADENWNPTERLPNRDAPVKVTSGRGPDDMVKVSLNQLYKIRSFLTDPELGKEVAADELTWLIEEAKSKSG